MTETLLFSPMTIRGVTLKNRIVVPRQARFWNAVVHVAKWVA
jgi:2,4-dienoyl-CoA reductase-like NADH-dependent reductase (Old Yellow Enzyme family)